MTHQEYKQMKEKEIEVFEQRLKDIIELEIDACDPSAPGVLDTLSDNRKLLADPILLRKATERFRELFWDNDEVTQLEHDAADQAMIETARSAPATSTGFSIVRDGRTIELTDDEVKAFRLAMARDEISGYIDGWRENLEYEAKRSDEEDGGEAGKLLDATGDEKARSRMLGAFSSSMMDECLPLFSEDENADAVWHDVVDSLFRPIARMIEEAE